MFQTLKPLALLTALLLSATSAVASILTWDRTEVRADMTPDQKDITATYTVTNNSEKPIRITDAKTSCGCTTSIMDRPILQPSESTTISATFNKGKRTGLNHSKIKVFIEGQKEPVATLDFIIDVIQAVKIQPKIVFWNKRTPHNAKTIDLYLNKDYAKSLQKPDYNKSTLKVTKQTIDKASGHYQLTIEPLDFTQAIRETILIDAKGNDGKKIPNKIHVFVQP